MKLSISKSIILSICSSAMWFAPVLNTALAQTGVNLGATPEIRTPKAPASPRINGPAIFGVRPGHPFFYHIPVTGDLFLISRHVAAVPR